MIKNLEYLNEELICDFCGKHFLRKQRNALNKSGRNFCSDLCSKRFSSRYGNTKEKQKQLLQQKRILLQDTQTNNWYYIIRGSITNDEFTMFFYDGLNNKQLQYVDSFNDFNYS